MTNTFTEEQYQRIVEKWEGETSYIEATKAVIKYLADEGVRYSIAEQALAIANPLTREWARDKFVEKEKKYMWKLKSKHETYLCYLLGSRSIIPANINLAFLTESEIKAWGYNPEMFDREEV